MIKGFKKGKLCLVIAILVFAMLSLAACGGGTNSTNSTPPEKEQSASQSQGQEQQPLATVEKPYEIEIHTTLFGTAGYVLAQGIADIINKNNPKLKAAVVEGSGMVDNNNTIQDPAKQKKALAAYATPYHSAIVNGEPPMQQPGKIEFLLTYFDGGFTVATLDPKIQKPEDLIGKKVNVGSPSAFGPQLPALFEAWGVRDKLGMEARMAQNQGKDALLDGTLDAAVFSSARTGNIIGASPALQEVLARPGAHLLNISKEDVDKIKQHYPEAEWMEAPAGSFGLQQATGILASINGYSVHPSFPPEIAYEIVKTLAENNDKLQEYHAYGKAILDKKFLVKLPRDLVPYNEGAIKYYKEAGIW